MAANLNRVGTGQRGQELPPKGLTLPLLLAKCRSTGRSACSSSSFAKKSGRSNTKFSTISSGVFPCTSIIALAKAATRSPLNSLVPSARCDIEGGDTGDELLNPTELAAAHEEDDPPDEQEATDEQEDLGEQEPEEHEGVRTGGAHE